MKNVSKLMVVFLAVMALTACTDATVAMYGSYGESSTITCYSGGDKVFEDTSTGKVQQIDGDGLTYKSAKNGQYVRAYADCIVTSK